jgi:uncharacterized membrane protein YoaK (UPF0700 family)
METNLWLMWAIFASPLVIFAIMFCVLSVICRKTQGEIKLILPPETLLKVMAVLLIVMVTFILAFQKILDQAVVATILGSVAAGTIGMDFRSKP